MSRRAFSLYFVCLLFVFSASVPQAQDTMRRVGGIRRVRGAIAGRYLVKLRGGDDPEAVGYESALIHRGRLRHAYHHALRGFAIELPEAAARALANDPRVEYVEEDGVTTGEALAVRTPVVSYGIDRIDQRVLPLDDAYHYGGTGAGVNVYVVDSGIRVTHQTFQGRAFGAYSAVSDGIPPNVDCMGHGTHVAGIVGGSDLGVASGVTLYSVKALDCNSQGTWGSYIDAIDWVVANHHKPAVINASIGGGYTSAAAEAINRAVAAGITFVGAAGNANADACLSIPGAAMGSITVGNATQSDQRSSDSNFGSCVALFAPGAGIESASNRDDSSTVSMWGTSMAAPHVAGAAALYLEHHPAATPNEVRAALLAAATPGVLTNMTAAGSNLLLFTPPLSDSMPPVPTTVGWAAGSIGSAADTGQASYAAGALTVTAAGTDVYGSADGFYFSHRQWTGDGDLVARVASLTSPLDAQFAIAGLMFRESAAADSRHASLILSTEGKVKFRRRTVSGGTTLSDGPSAGAAFAPSWLKLSRRGDTFSASLSADGRAWKPVFTSTTVTMPPTIEVGLFALRSGGSGLAHATFDNIALGRVPAGWAVADVGAVAGVGATTVSDDAFTVEGTGTDLWSSADAFHLAYTPWTGDGEMVARVDGLTAPTGANFALAAITMRESLDAESRHASLALTTDGKAKFRRRLSVAGATASDGPSTGSTTLPRWVRLTRRGQEFTAFTSTDGVQWQRVHTPQTVAMAPTIYVGVLGLRNGGTGIATAHFSQVVVRP